MPLVLKIGPVPEVFGAEMFTPFWRRQVANFASAASRAGLLARRPAPANVLASHFFSAAWYCALVTPLGRCAEWAPRKRRVGDWPGVVGGSAIPFFCKHSRRAVKRLAASPAGLPVAAVVVVAADALVGEDEDEDFDDKE